MPNLARLLWYLNGAMRRLHWDKEKLRRYQEKRLRAVVKYAYDFVPFYHEKFRAAGVLPSDIRTLENLSKLPVIWKDVIKDESSTRVVSREFRVNRLKEVRTSGSTGKPFQVFINGVEDDWRKSIYMRANISCGQRARDRWVVVTTPHHFSDTTGLQRVLGVFAQTCVNLYSGVSEQIRLVKEARPDVLDGYSGWLVSLAKEVKRRGVESIRPRIMFGSAEFMDEASVKLVEDVFGAPFYDQFGCSEVDRTAWVCPAKVGYHMDVDSVITQFVDDEGEEVACGESGDVLYTSLFNYAMPLIRYGVGDVGAASDEECSCGRVLPLMKVVEGRSDSLLVLPDGGFLSPVTFLAAMNAFDLYDQIEEFRLVQKKVDLFKIFIRKKDSSVDEDVLGSRLAAHVAKSLGTDVSGVNVDVEFVDEIPVGSGGKHRSVVSEVRV